MAPQQSCPARPLNSRFGVLALSYLTECERHALKPNALLFKKLDSASKDHKEGRAVRLVCYGNEKETFLERLGDSDFAALLQALQNCGARLQELDFRFQSLSEETGSLFVLHRSVVEPLERLCLKANLLDEAAAEKLCGALTHCSQLKLLDLSQNKLNKNGGKALARLLAQAKHLQVLDISDCQLDLEAFVHLTTAMQDSNTVRHPKPQTLNPRP